MSQPLPRRPAPQPTPVVEVRTVASEDCLEAARQFWRQFTDEQLADVEALGARIEDVYEVAR